MTIRRPAILIALTLAAASLAPVGCDQPASNKYTINSQQTPDGSPRLTMTTQLDADDEKGGRSFKMALDLSGVGGSSWGTNIMTQGLTLTLVSLGGPALPETDLFVVREGQRSVPFGEGSAGSQLRETPQGSKPCPSYALHLPAARIKQLVGARYAECTLGDVKFRIEDDQIRAMAELMRRLDATTK